MIIKNENFLSEFMTGSDCKLAFSFNVGEKLKGSINELISEGWLKKKSERYFSATEKLLDFVFLPGIIELTSFQRKFLTLNDQFSRKDLVEIFGNEQAVKRMIKDCLFVFNSRKTYKKSEQLEDILADGEDIIINSLKGTEGKEAI